MTNEQKIETELLPTWQTLAAIAYRADVKNVVALDVLLKMHSHGSINLHRVRICNNDKEKVYFFKRSKQIKANNQI